VHIGGIPVIGNQEPFTTCPEVSLKLLHFLRAKYLNSDDGFQSCFGGFQEIAGLNAQVKCRSRLMCMCVHLDESENPLFKTKKNETEKT
jgi:hypothetical protein